MNELSNIKETLSIERVIQDETHLEIKRIGRSRFLEVCPFCGSGKGKNGTSAFSIYKDRSFQCFASCGKKGSVVDFIAMFRDISDKEASKLILSKYGNGIDINKGKQFTEWEKKLFAIKNNPKDKATQYLTNERKINLGNVPKSAYYYDSYYNAIVFISHNCNMLNYRMINPQKGQSKSINKLLDDKHRMNEALYVESFNSKSNTVFITEGVINALSLYPKSAISIFSSHNSIDINILKPYIENKKVVLAFDNDKSGNKAFCHYCEIIEDSGLAFDIRKLNLPKPVKSESTGEIYTMDINDLLKENRLSDWLKKKSNYELIYENRILKPIEENSEDIEEMWKEVGFYHSDGRYFGRDQKGNERRISNFLMDIIYHFPDGSKNSLRYVKLQKSKDKEIKSETVLFDSESLSSVQKFKSTLYAYGDYIFSGSAKDLDVIKEALGEVTEEAIRMDVLGWSTEHEVYVFANGIIKQRKFIGINKFGIVKTNENRLFIPPMSEIYLDDEGYSSERRFIFRSSSMSVCDFSSLIDQAYGINGVIGLLFTIGSVFSDIIARELDFFPILFLYGTAGSGKTSYANFFLGFFGEPQNPISLSGQSTGKAMMRKLSQYNDALIFLNEYKPDIAGKIDDMIVNIYDRVGYDRALMTNDNRTSQTKVSSGVIVDGNFLPVKHPRTYSRLIQLDFMDKAFTDAQKAAYKKIDDSLKSETFTGLLFEIIQFRNLVDSHFRKEFYKMESELKHFYGNKGFDNRIIVNNCVLLTLIKLLEKPLKLPFDFDKIREEIMEVAKVQQSVLSQTNELEQFFESIETNIASPRLYGKYLYDQEYFYIHLPTAYRVYQEDMRQINGLAVDKMSLAKQLEKHPFFVNKTIIRIEGKTQRVIQFKREIIKGNQ